MEITNSNDWTAMRSRLAAPIAVPSYFATGVFLSAKGGLRPQAAVDATFLGPQSWSPLIT